MNNTSAKIQIALDRIDRAVADHPKKNIKGIRSLYSGGHDSLVAAHLASQHPFFQGLIHINTMTSPAAFLVTQYARKVAAAYQWDFIESIPFLTFVQIIVKYGFPTPSAHPFVYQYLKGRALMQARLTAREKLSSHQATSESAFYDLFPAAAPKKAKRNSPDIAFISGIRRLESVARSQTPEYGVSDSVLWINPIIDWTKEECSEYIQEHQLLRNGYADKTGISGECDCAAYAQDGEMNLKCQVVPFMQEYRQMLEGLARAARDIQLFEVKTMGRDPSTVIDLHDTVWGNGRINDHYGRKDQAVQLALFSICSDCQVSLEGENLSPDAAIELEFMKMKERRNG